MRRYANVLFGSIPLILLLGGATESAAESERTVPIAFIAAQSVRELQQAARPLLIVDVRTGEEFEAGHISGAVSIPLRELRWRYQEIPRQGLVVLY